MANRLLSPQISARFIAGKVSFDIFSIAAKIIPKEEDCGINLESKSSVICFETQILSRGFISSSITRPLANRYYRPSDAYHTCYVLSGLSSAQHTFTYVRRNDNCEPWDITPHVVERQVFDERDRLATLHPVYVISQSKVEAIRSYFVAKSGF